MPNRASRTAKTLRTRAPEATRERLVAAAFQQIHRHGYQGAGLDTILASAGVTKGALYHHFANKKELYQAVVEDMEQELVERLEAAGAGRAPWERLSAMCSAYVDACREPALARMLVLEAPAVLGWKTWCNLEQRYEVAAFARCLKEIDGLNEPAETLAQVILGALTTGARVIATAPDPEAARTEVQQTIDRLICGLRSTAR